jgi:heat shock factor-binding protein 1
MATPPSQASALDPVPADASSELTAAVDDLLETVRSKFSTATSEMLAKMDDMSRRLDNLEAVLRASGGNGDAQGTTGEQRVGT